MAKSPRIFKVAVLVETSRSIGRQLLQGISQYVHQHGPWSIYHQERTLRDGIPRWMRNWHGDGVMARLETPEEKAKIHQMGIPAVDLFMWNAGFDMPTLNVDERNVAKMAANHLLERGFRQFAYCGFGGIHYSDHRCECFVQYLAELGNEVSVYMEHIQSRARLTSTEIGGLRHEHEIGTWLCSLPKPVGLMTCNDIRGQQVLNACTEQGIAVPDEIAVIGVDNDILMCEMCLPSLSSIELDGIRGGFEAARMLDHLMHGRRRIRNGVLKPLGVVTRQSTDSVATADKDVIAAVQFIRHHASKGIEVADVLREISLSRSTLERRFASLFGHTINAEIDRVKLNHVKELLTRTDWILRRIADEAGFQHIEPLCRLFKRKTGLTPGAFRRRSRAVS